MAYKEIVNGTLIQFTEDNTKWRVIHVSTSSYHMINAESGGYEFKDVSFEDITVGMLNGKIVVPENQELYVIDTEKLPENANENLEQNLNFVNEVSEVYGPFYNALASKRPKPQFTELEEKYGFSHSKAYRLVLSWLQFGKQTCGLVDKRYRTIYEDREYHYTHKTGRKGVKRKGVVRDEYCIQAFEYGLAIKRKFRTADLTYCYGRLIAKFYSTEVNGELVHLPDDQIPTLKQFRLYCSKKLSQQEKDIIATSEAEYRNNQRILYGTSRYGIPRPGYLLEIDAVETDLYIVSSVDPTQVIGRPVIYMMVDIYSHCIVAASVGFDNNSNRGLTNVLFNFFEDKGNVACKSNVKIDTDNWPSGFLPNTIRCDRGADFESDKFERICRLLGINRQLCTGATGSMKGTIEQLFRQFHKTFAVELEKKGFIQKRYDSNHKKEALLTIDEVSQLVILFIMYHNVNNIKSFQLTRDMVNAGVMKNPISIWRYGVEKGGSQAPVIESKRNEIFYNLLLDDNAGISREGVYFKGLYYIPCGDKDIVEKMKMAKVNAKKKDSDAKLLNSMAVHSDPRTTNYLYYLKDGKVMQLVLNREKSGSYANMTWNQYTDYQKIQTIRDSEADSQNLNYLIQRQAAVDAIVASAPKATGEPNAKNIRENRRIENETRNFENAASNLIQPENPITEDTVLVKEDGTVFLDKKENVCLSESIVPSTEETSVLTDAADETKDETVFSDKVPSRFKRK